MKKFISLATYVVALLCPIFLHAQTEKICFKNESIAKLKTVNAKFSWIYSPDTAQIHTIILCNKPSDEQLTVEIPGFNKDIIIDSAEKITLAGESKDFSYQNGTLTLHVLMQGFGTSLFTVTIQLLDNDKENYQKFEKAMKKRKK